MIDPDIVLNHVRLQFSEVLRIFRVVSDAVEVFASELPDSILGLSNSSDNAVVLVIYGLS